VAKFCKKCGTQIESDERFCSECGNETGNDVAGNVVVPVQVPVAAKQPSQQQKAQKSQKKRPKKKKRTLLKLIAVLLALLIASSSVLGALTFFNIIDIPIVSSLMSLIGIGGGNGNANDAQFNSLTGKFTEIPITDERSAIAAVQDAAGLMGLYNAANELTPIHANTVDGSTYYRLQQNYNGIPVYGRTFVVIADENGNAQGLTSNAADIPGNVTLTASVTQEQINSSVRDYVQKELRQINATNIAVKSISDDNLIIYSLDGSGNFILAYDLHVSFEIESRTLSLNVFLDAKSGKIFLVPQTINSQRAISYNSDQSISFNGFLVDEGDDSYHIMRDSDRNVYIYNGGNQEVFSDVNRNIVANVDVAEIVRSGDNIFGNEDDDPNVDYTMAFNFLQNLSKIYDFFNVSYGERGIGGVLGIYGDNFHFHRNGVHQQSCTPGDNALGGVVPITAIRNDGLPDYNAADIGLVSMGSQTGINAIDTLGHEYTHFVTRSNVDWATTPAGQDDVIGAINEGYSDIFGEIIQGHLSNSEPDWEHGSRIIHNPKQNKYPKKITDKNNGGEDYSHGYSTCVSHAAYLMRTGVNNTQTALSMNELSDLWYRTMLTLPPDCTYSMLRGSMEVTAEMLGYSTAKKNCIAAAFDAVGIASPQKDGETYSMNTRISVLDKNGATYDDYTITISGTQNVALWGAFNKPYSKTITVTSTRAQDIDVPKGTYTITITDNFNRARTVSKQIKARNNHKNDELKFATNFGFDYALPTNAELTVYDKNNLVYDDYSIRINGTYNDGTNANATYSDTITVDRAASIPLNLNEGKYSIMLIDGKDSAKTKTLSVLVRSGASGSSDLKIKTNFGKGTGEFNKSKVPSGAVERNGHFYYVYNMPDTIGTWEEARDFCFEREGYLATLTTQEESDFVYEHVMKAFGYDSAYFGLYDHSGYNTDWRWVTGEEFDFINWAEGEPSSYNERYGMFFYLFAEDEFYTSRGMQKSWNDGDFGYWTHNGGKAFICEWGEYTLTGDDVDDDLPTIRTTSDERDIVLVLDTSGSMSGTPINETKKASVNFIDTILKENASIGIVTYASGANVVSDFSMNQRSLESAANGIGSGGGTNMDSGLKTAYEMLQYSNAKKKIIVLMSDGQPNEGRTGDSLISFADEIKNDGIYIYALGFFHELSGSSKVAAQNIMGAIANEGCHYEVDDADNLVFFFGDIADQINGQKYIYIRVACPVDVAVTFNGETLSSADKDMNTRTAFGSLTFEENKNNEDDKIKILRLKDGTEYDIQIVGKARGKMDYTIGLMDENGEYSDFRRFRGVPITRTTVIDTVAKSSGSTILNVDTDGNGKYDLRYKAGANEYGQLVDYTYIYYIVFSSVAALAFLVVVLRVRKRIKAKRH